MLPAPGSLRSVEDPPEQTVAGAGAAEQWRAELAAWAIPDDILAAAPENPWGFPVELFRAAESAPETTPSRERALEALPPRGNVLDVGCGGGRAGLALVPPAGRLVGVDESADMLAAFAEAADGRGIAHGEVLGSWPAVAGDVEPVDVVVCHHVAYNVSELVPFAEALSAKAVSRVVLELTQLHPMVATAPLWRRFHGLDRPAGPSCDLALAVLREGGIDAAMETFEVRLAPPRRDILVAFTRRRLCLPASRDAEVEDALVADEWISRRLATIWWDT